MEFIKAMLLILVAEMGDKTQIVAMAFATKYKLHQILIGVALGSAANHGLAIAFGTLLTQYLDMSIIQSAAGGLFLIFAFLSLQIEDPEEESESKERFGPLLTVALAFFIGELGDKTQLTALSLSTDASYPLLILLGTTTGMVLTSLIGILIAQKFGERIPEEVMKILAAAAFLIFGVQKVIAAAGLFGVADVAVYSFIALIIGIMGLRLKQFHASLRTAQQTKLRQRAEALYNTALMLRSGIDEMCLGEASCGSCKGRECLIGYMKMILSYVESGRDVPKSALSAIGKLIHRDVDKAVLYRTLKTILDYYESHPEEFLRNTALKEIRKSLEALLSDEKLQDFEHYKDYRDWVETHINKGETLTQIDLK